MVVSGQPGGKPKLVMGQPVGKPQLVMGHPLPVRLNSQDGQFSGSPQLARLNTTSQTGTYFLDYFCLFAFESCNDLIRNV